MADHNFPSKNPKNSLSPQSISATTLAISDMAASVRFYVSLGFQALHGGENANFTSFAVGSSYLNLVPSPNRDYSWWGRIIFYVADVDAFYEHALLNGHQPDTIPSDAPWGERYFHLTDPDGHELSFAKPLSSLSQPANRSLNTSPNRPVH